MHKLGNQLIFNVGATIYDHLTDQDIWRQQIRGLLQYADLPSDGAIRLLDVGCGPGVSTFALAEALGEGASLTGVDLAPKMIAKAKRHHARRYAALKNVSFEQADATHLRFDDDSFDLVTAHSFLYLVPDPTAILKELRRVLRPGGKAIFMEPAASGNLVQASLNALPQADTLISEPRGAIPFVVSMVAWRVVSGVAGQLDPAVVRDWFVAAGFQDIAFEPTLGGLGMHCIGS